MHDKRIGIAALVVLVGCLYATLVVADDNGISYHPVGKVEEQINNGQDITRPLTRVDARYQFVNVPGGHQQNILTFRSDGAVRFSDKWEIALRGDIPLVCGDVPAVDNVTPDMQFGFGDVVTQVVPVYVIDSRTALGFGAQFIWPTASNNQSGTGKFVAMPLAGVRMSLPEISNGSFFLPYFRYETSYAGSMQRNDISKLEFAPMVNIMLPEKMFAVLWSSPEITFDYMQNAWTFPMNFMVGKMLSDKMVGSVEFFIPMFEDKDYVRPYHFKMEFRIGFFF